MGCTREHAAVRANAGAPIEWIVRPEGPQSFAVAPAGEKTSDPLFRQTL